MLLKLLLGPLLLLQGKWVRKRTPKLPEPIIKTSGVVGQGKPLSLLLLGDSSAAGVGAETAEQSLMGQLLVHLSQNHQVSYQMMAKTGRTTANMISKLQHEPPQHFDVVITALGVNDVTSQVPVNTWLQQQQHLIGLIDELFNPQKIIKSGLPPMREFPALPWPLNAYMGQSADKFDVALKEQCANFEHVTFHSLRNYPDDVSTASDGFHPGPDVYAIWGEKLASEINL